MGKEVHSERKNVWPYIVWPPVVLNVGAVLLMGSLYAVRYATATAPTPETIQLDYGQIQFSLSIFIFLAEWFFAGLLIYRYRRSGEPLQSLFSLTGDPFEFRRGPAISLFATFNLIFLAYILYLLNRMPELSYRDMNLLQAISFILLVPFTAGFAEELIWRGHILSGLKLRGVSARKALLISAISFALIHGVFLPDKLLVTFLVGIVAGVYYLRERNLMPLIVTHWFVDVWSFGLFFFR